MWITYFIGCFLSYWIITRHIIKEDVILESEWRGHSTWKIITMVILVQILGAALSWFIVLLEMRYELFNWCRWIIKAVKTIIVNIKLTCKFWWIGFFNIPL